MLKKNLHLTGYVNLLEKHHWEFIWHTHPPWATLTDREALETRFISAPVLTDDCMCKGVLHHKIITTKCADKH